MKLLLFMLNDFNKYWRFNDIITIHMHNVAVRGIVLLLLRSRQCNESQLNWFIPLLNWHRSRMKVINILL